MGNEDGDSNKFRNEIVSMFNSKSIDENKKREMFIPKVILNVKNDEDLKVHSVKMGTSVDGGGLVHTYSVSWKMEGSGEEEKGVELKKMSSEAKIQEGKKTGKIQCDGPCGKYVDMADVVQFGCDHLICDKCRQSQNSEALYDGAPGCCHVDCVANAIQSGMKIRAGRKLHSASSCTIRSNEGPVEVLHVHVSIVAKFDQQVYRYKHTYEFPTHTRLAELNGVLAQFKDLISTARVYYSIRKPLNREDLRRISLVDTNLRFYHLPGYEPLTNGDLYILIVADGVRVY